MGQGVSASGVRLRGRNLRGCDMNAKVAELKTDPELLRSLHEAAQRKPTAEEALEQRASFVVGSLKSDSGMTREEVKRLIKETAE